MSIKSEILTKRVGKILLNDISKNEINNVLKQIAKSKDKPALLSLKIKIHPTIEQQKVLWALAENCRLIYNFALEERKKWWEKNKDLPKKQREKIPSYISQQNQLPCLKKEYPQYQQNYSKTLQMSLRQLNADFKSFYVLKDKGFTNANPPRFKSKKYFTTLFYNQSGFKIKDNHITFTHNYPTKERKKIDLTFELQNIDDYSGKNIKQVTIFQNHKSKEFHLIIIYEKETKTYKDNNIYQAIDLGVMNLIAGVNNHAGKILIIKNNRVDKYWQPKIEELQAKRDRCLKGSNRWNWYNYKMTAIIRKQTNQQKDFQHKISKKIIEKTKAQTIIIGDLSVKQMVKKIRGDRKNNRSLKRTMQNTGCLSRFTRFLTYKAELAGKKVIRISEKRTTKRCCYCMEKKARHLSERIIFCEKCGMSINRDVNGAVNILQRFLAILSLSHKRPLVRQQLLKNFRKLFFAINSQPSNESFSFIRVGRTRKKSFDRSKFCGL
ncbi:MAG: IS200/IS605 family element transposase accessory protein TnpB [Candidatus Heimdallarchaeota archaeon]